MQKGGHVYIMTNAHRTVLYTGMTSDLVGRTDQHKTHFYKNSFTARYNIEFLVYYEHHGHITDVIIREKKVKKLSRSRKIELINSMNPDWKDLWDEIS
ncbi:MAG: Excinuclease subunit domain protein [Flavipsychrobacter sp.]|nr:Excinuclease subunit domain protein [Flavipsychrobacter sp.]